MCVPSYRKRYLDRQSSHLNKEWRVNTFSLPTRHILKLGQDHLASLFDAQGNPLASFFDLQGPPLFSFVCLSLMVCMHLYKARKK